MQIKDTISRLIYIESNLICKSKALPPRLRHVQSRWRSNPVLIRIQSNLTRA